MFFVKEHLSPRHIHDLSLNKLFHAFEVKCVEKPGMKKPLLKYLYPNRPLGEAFPKQQPTAEENEKSKLLKKILDLDILKILADIYNFN